MADDELIDDICDRWFDPSGPTEGHYEDRYAIVPHVLAILRSLPVEQRMAAMGMEHSYPKRNGEWVFWVEADR